MEIQKEIENKYIIGQPKNRGIVAMPLVLDYGESHKVISLQASSNFKEILGYSLEASELILLKEAFKRAKQVLIYRLNSGEHATCKTPCLTLTAKYPGTRGNALTVYIVPYKQWQQKWGQVSKSGVGEERGQVSKNGVEEERGQVPKSGVEEKWGQVSKNGVEEERGQVSKSGVGEERGQVSKSGVEEKWGQVSKNGVEEERGQVSKSGVGEEWGQVSKSGVGEERGQVFKKGVRYVVVTRLQGEVVDWRGVNEIGELKENSYVRFEVGNKLWEVDDVMEFRLDGGMDYKVSSKEWEGFLETIRRYEWRAMAIATEENRVKRKVTEFIKGLREVEGRGVYAVMAHYGEANHMGVISVANGVKLADGMQLTRYECTAWMAGVVASAGLRQNEAQFIYEEAVEVDKRFNKAQVNKLIEDGHIVFVKRSNKIGIAEDINTFKKFTPKWGEAYHRNAFVRMIDVMKYDLHRMMKIYYLGSIKMGKSMQESKSCFKEICVRYMEMLQSKHVLYQVNPVTDIEVFLAEDMRGVDISLVLKDSEIDKKTYVSILYNKFIG